MSRLPLPRLHSSQDTSTQPGPAMSSQFTFGMKRKMTQEEDDEAADQPRKLPAFGSARNTNEPLRPSRKAANNNIGASSSTNAPPPLTKPRAPTLSTSRTTRATSAPPKSVSVRTGLGASTSATQARRPPTNRVTSNPTDRRFQDLQTQLTSLESARAADAARLAADMESERRKVSELQTNQHSMLDELTAAKTQALTQRRELMNASDELEAMKKRHAAEISELELVGRRKDREAREREEDLRVARADLERERSTTSALKSTLAQQETAQLGLTTKLTVLQTQIAALQGQLDGSTTDASSLKQQLYAAEKRILALECELREAEGTRRRLHNMVQELKGNIRVFCRVRPVLPSDESGLGLAQITFPDQRDHREIVLSSSSESAMGQERREVYNFGFDRVFEAGATQAEVFEEISQLAQSCTDGYNVCIFAYGQTGSGKSFTMEGGPTEDTKGMIPRAVDQVFRVAEDLKSKGWEYTMEGQFLEIVSPSPPPLPFPRAHFAQYNETINDLLGTHEFDKKKHEIRHDASTHTTRVTDVAVHPLSSPAQVRALLARAQSRRSVAATLMNERSSRSHSVFTLRIRGCNAHTGEVCGGSLNLVDLAGSERLGSMGDAGGDRVKETKNINRSLSALGDVIRREMGCGGCDRRGRDFVITAWFCYFDTLVPPLLRSTPNSVFASLCSASI
ncbi:hypothetical protein PLICRDRAFT_42749 [Plicaturopsis crispa FD-325 SS-3]|nr:hypothetical protein PLICRDRAFT_42749 [Plicaturopsis crispa FD-325 SS-3]